MKSTIIPTNIAEEKDIPVPYCVFDGEMARQERHFKRLWIVIIMLIVFLVGSNIAWILYESQFSEIELSQEIESDMIERSAITVMGDVDYNGED